MRYPTYDRFDGMYWQPPFSGIFISILIISWRVLEESERHVEIDQTATYEDRDTNRAIWVNYPRTACQLERRIEGREHETVRMPHWGDEAHLGGAQGKVLRERQPGLEDPSFAVVRGKIRYNWTSGTSEYSLECVWWSENPLDRKAIISSSRE